MSATIRWTCPACGLLNRSRVTYGQYDVQCHYQRCRKPIVFGLRFLMPQSTGKSRAIPPDAIIPAGIERAHPGIAPDIEVECDRWRPGEPIHRATTER